MAFLVFEGLDASGKSTLIKGLGKALENRGLPFIVTREPGGTPLGDELRQILLRKDGDIPTPKAEVLLYQVIRAQHVEKKIRPHLEKGDWVLSDRYSASSIAFQAGGRGVQDEEIHWLNEFSTSGLKPDLWVLLDLSIEESAKRMDGRAQEKNQEKDRFEEEKKDFHQRVRQKYLHLAEQSPDKWLVLDACLSPDELLETLIHELEKRKWLI